MAPSVLAPWAEAVPGRTGLMTAEELSRLPEDSWLYELVEGRLVRMPPPKSRHGRLGMKLALALGAVVESRALGALFLAETGFQVSRAGEPDTVLGADIAFVRQERLPPPDSPEWSDYLRLAPDLVVEVASPTQFRPEMEAKARVWLAAGVSLLWVIWPRWRSVDVWRQGGVAPTGLTVDQALDGLDVVPGFTYPLTELFG